MKVKMSGHDLEASGECISDLILAVGYAMEYCRNNNLPVLYEMFYDMHSDLYYALEDSAYFGKHFTVQL